MRNFLILLAFMTALPGAGEAAPKAGQWLGWYPAKGEWNNYTRYNPHLENGTHPHPETWRGDQWHPRDWIQQKQDGNALVQGFYQSDIIRDHGMEENVAVIVVGPNFYRLGGQEKSSVIASLSEVQGYAGTQSNQVVLLRDWYTNRDIGAFTAQGLMLQ